MLDKSNRKPETGEPIVIKKYANRRLYNTESSTYVTLEDLAQMVRSDRDFVVCDAKTGDDLTHAVLTQIIVEQESRAGGANLLPIPFLRQLIRFYDDSFARMVPSYLQCSLEALVREQQRYREQFASTWGGTGFEAYQEQARKNLAVFEQAMAMWSPFTGIAAHATGAHKPAATPAEAPEPAAPAGVPSAAAPEPAEQDAPPSAPQSMPSEIEVLKAELAAMQRRIERLSQDHS